MIVKILGSASSNFHGVQYNEKKLNLEETRLIADIILNALESVQKIGQIVGTAAIK